MEKQWVKLMGRWLVFPTGLPWATLSVQLMARWLALPTGLY
jgi:hypothetical protein